MDATSKLIVLLFAIAASTLLLVVFLGWRPFQRTQDLLNTTVRAVNYSLDRTSTERKLRKEPPVFVGKPLELAECIFTIEEALTRVSYEEQVAFAISYLAEVARRWMMNNEPWSSERLGGAEGRYRNGVWASSGEAVLS